VQGGKSSICDTEVDSRFATDWCAPEHCDLAAVVSAPSQTKEVAVMDWNRVEGNWKQVKGKVKEKWGKLTDDDLDVVGGRLDRLEGKIQERYGIARDQARKDIDDWYGTQKW
jgi:uncharacterized protein YjbJ (UPF0337 family)